ncbi:MAG: type II secretion system protein [Planctomycetes bacterium]|nr:type II secretion system protein [Planctomycetota bacterium]
MQVKIKNRGFTLIELLVVISIIALLMGIMMPVVGRVRTVAKRTVCVSNLRNIGIGFRLYLDENNDYMPPATNMPSLALNKKKPITFYLDRHIGQKKIFKCPGDTVDKYFATEESSYAYNNWLGNRRVSDSFLTKRFNVKERNIHVMYDYKPFHGKAGKVGAKNYLYADGHTGNLRNQE